MTVRYRVLVNFDDKSTTFLEARGSPYTTMKEANEAFDERVAAGEHHVRLMRMSSVLLKEHVGE